MSSAPPPDRYAGMAELAGRRSDWTGRTTRPVVPGAGAAPGTVGCAGSFGAAAASATGPELGT
ncbi:hypothetical protein [Variovorax sp. LT1R16]|uniref:hypothetical protein n=1 Tax=Variovorax sp. LT1R16 TaxID=3443728 RepID=UPI003F44BE5D